MWLLTTLPEQAGSDVSLQVQSKNHGKFPLVGKAHSTSQCA